MLADNRIFDLGVDDMSAFDALIAELGDDLDVPGFDDELLQSLKASCEEVDEIMSSYGIIDEEKKDQIVSARAEYEKADEQRQSQMVQKEKSETPAPQVEAPEDKYVVCPKCGEKIWL